MEPPRWTPVFSGPHRRWKRPASRGPWLVLIGVMVLIVLTVLLGPSLIPNWDGNLGPIQLR